MINICSYFALISQGYQLNLSLANEVDVSAGVGSYVCECLCMCVSSVYLLLGLLSPFYSRILPRASAG